MLVVAPPYYKRPGQDIVKSRPLLQPITLQEIKKYRQACTNKKINYFIFTLCRPGEIIVAPPLKIFPPPLTFSPKSGLARQTDVITVMFCFACYS